MRTVPAHYVDLALDLDLERRESILALGIKFGDRVEIDLDKVWAMDEEAATELAMYGRKVQNFWDSYVATGKGGECLMTERTIVRYAKVDSKEARVYLKDQITELEALNGFGPELKKVFAGTFDEEGLATAGIIGSKEGNVITLSFEVDTKMPWSDHLGGLPSRGEIGRSFELRVSHAKSHDRKAQRLLEVVVKAKEIWPA